MIDEKLVLDLGQVVLPVSRARTDGGPGTLIGFEWGAALSSGGIVSGEFLVPVEGSGSIGPAMKIAREAINETLAAYFPPNRLNRPVVPPSGPPPEAPAATPAPQPAASSSAPPATAPRTSPPVVGRTTTARGPAKPKTVTRAPTPPPEPVPEPDPVDADPADPVDADPTDVDGAGEAASDNPLDYVVQYPSQKYKGMTLGEVLQKPTGRAAMDFFANSKDMVMNAGGLDFTELREKARAVLATLPPPKK